MKRICIYQVAAAFWACLGMAWAQTTCPAFVKKTGIVGALGTLAVKGTVVSAVRYKGGIYASPLGQNAPVLIPNTQNDVNANSLQISEDGQWLVYNAGGIYVIGVNGLHRTKVPVTASGSEGCCTVWWHDPKGGTEIVYRINGDAIVHAIPITWNAQNGPTFGTDRVIAQFNERIEFTMSVSGAHMWTRLDDSRFGPQFITIPTIGVAGDANFWKHTNPPSWGCMTTMSHDGSMCCFNAGYDQWCACLADEFCLLRHKSFVVLPFQEQTAPSVGWDSTLLKIRAFSVNWAPPQYVFVDSNNLGSDFKGWNYTNDSSYMAGDLMGQKVGADSGSIWLVHWPSNTWTKILSLDAAHLLAFPSVWIDRTVNTIAPLRGNRGEHPTDPSLGIRYIVDTKGRIVSSSGTARNLSPGVYYAAVPGKVMRRIVVGR
jgi:hypothetical protein